MSTKKVTISFNFILLLIILFFVVRSEKGINQRLDSIEQRIDQREILDNAYREHLNECAFVSKQELRFDSRGYLYSTYKRRGR